MTFSCSGTIPLSATITIATDTTIDGSGQTVTISGNNAVRVFTVNSGVAFNLNGLTVANGIMVFTIVCGIVNNGGTVSVSNSTFSGCTGIQNEGTLVVTNSTFSRNSGPGIVNLSPGPVTVNNCTFSGNSYYAICGGSGGVTVGNSIFYSNGNSDDDGGIQNGFSTVAVSNSAFSGHSAHTGGDIFGDHGAVTLKHMIGANSPTDANCVGAITDGGGNLSYPDTTCPGINRDPKLGPLQNNGGPTQTMALLPGNAAIDAAIDAICAAPPVNNLDQRGITRPQGLHCDIGAYEALPYPHVYLPIILR